MNPAEVASVGRGGAEGRRGGGALACGACLNLFPEAFARLLCPGAAPFSSRRMKMRDNRSRAADLIVLENEHHAKLERCYNKHSACRRGGNVLKESDSAAIQTSISNGVAKGFDRHINSAPAIRLHCVLLDVSSNDFQPRLSAAKVQNDVDAQESA